MRYAAFLRAVNVGRRATAMADLRACVESVGYSGVATVLQSGTVVLTGSGAEKAIEAKLRGALRAQLELETAVIVRSAADIRALIEGNPFDAMAQDDPSHLVCVVLKDTVSPANVIALQKAIVGREQVALGERALYVTYPDGIGESKLTAAMIDRLLNTACTARNWNTMRRIDALLG